MKQILFFMLLASPSLFAAKADKSDVKEYLLQEFDNATDPISLEDFPSAIKPEFTLTCSMFRGRWENLNMSRHTVANSKRSYAPMGPLFSDNVETGKDSLSGIVYTNGTSHDADYYNEMVKNSKYSITDRQIVFTWGSQTVTLRKSGPYIFFLWGTDGFGYCWREKNQ
jgi:hypothetical protein